MAGWARIPDPPYRVCVYNPDMVREVSTTANLKRWRPATEHATENATPVSREMVAAVVPQHILHGDEIVLLLIKPSLWFIVLTSFRFLLATVLAGSLFLHFGFGSSGWVSPQNIAAATTLLCIGRLIWALLVWTSHIYILTNLRILTIKGVLNVNVFGAPLRKIQRTVLYKSLLLRILGLGTIGFATAATTGFDSTWVMIPRPLQTHEQIVAAIQKSQNGGNP